MAQRFYGVLAWLFILAMTAGIFLWAYRGIEKAQPVAYSHKKHVADLGLECGQCHAGIAEHKAHAGLPALETCLSCHGEEDNPKTRLIRTYASNKQEIPWVRIYRVPAHVYFSHRRHVEIAKLDCALCHGDMSKKETPVTRQAIPIRMERCMACHRQKKASNDCLACHR